MYSSGRLKRLGRKSILFGQTPSVSEVEGHGMRVAYASRRALSVRFRELSEWVRSATVPSLKKRKRGHLAAAQELKDEPRSLPGRFQLPFLRLPAISRRASCRPRLAADARGCAFVSRRQRRALPLPHQPVSPLFHIIMPHTGHCLCGATQASLRCTASRRRSDDLSTSDRGRVDPR